MNKHQYKELRRQYRIVHRLAEELVIDHMIYGTSFQIQDDCGIFNIPPNEIVFEDGKLKWNTPR